MKEIIVGRKNTSIRESIRSRHTGGMDFKLARACSQSDTNVKAVLESIVLNWPNLSNESIQVIFEIRSGYKVSLATVEQMREGQTVDNYAMDEVKTNHTVSAAYRERYIRRLNQLYDVGFIGIRYKSHPVTPYECRYRDGLGTGKNHFAQTGSLKAAVAWIDLLERQCVPELWRVLLQPNQAELGTLKQAFDMVWPEFQHRMPDIRITSRPKITRNLIRIGARRAK